MIQLIDLMILMVGCYIITRMMIFLLRDDPKQSTLAIVINKILAAGTIIITIICIILAMTSFVSTLDLEELIG